MSANVVSPHFPWCDGSRAKSCDGSSRQPVRFLWSRLHPTACLHFGVDMSLPDVGMMPCHVGQSAFREAMSMEKRYFTSDRISRS